MTEDLLWPQPQVARLMSAVRRLRHADRERPWLLDAGLVLSLTLLALFTGNGHESADRTAGLPTSGVVALQLGLILPLLWRRRAPSAVFAVVLAVFLVQWSLNVVLHSDLALLIALYSLARHGRLRHLYVAGGAMVGALLLAAVRAPVDVSPLVTLFFLGSATIAAIAPGLGIRLGWAYLTALKDRAARLEVERDQRSRLAAAAERARIAREMHDIVGHNLAVVIGLADGGAHAADTSPERAQQALRLIAGTSRQSLGELRRTLAVLRREPGDDGADVDSGTYASGGAELSPQPGVADLDALCAVVSAAGPQVVYRTVGRPDALDPGIQLTVYRIAQEALTNTLKHAGADTRARLTLAAEADEVRLRVDDTGPPGGRPGHRQPMSGDGHGIAGMRERAALYGGTVTAGPRPDGGWSVDAVLHLTPSPAPDPAFPLPRTAGAA